MSVSGADRPTISLQPADESQEITRFLRRLSAENFAFFVESGISPTYLSLLWFDSINRVNNAPSVRKSNLLDAEIRDYAAFRRAVELLDELERSKIAQFVVREPFEPVGRPVAARTGLAVGSTRSRRRKEWNTTTARAPGRLSWCAGSEACGSRSTAWPRNARAHGILPLAESRARPARVRADRGRGRPVSGNFPPPPRRQSCSSRARLSRRSSTCLMASPFRRSTSSKASSGRRFLPTANSSIGPNSRAECSRFSTSNNIIGPSMRTSLCNFKGYWFFIDDRDHNSKMAFNQVYHLSRLDLAVPGARLERTRPVLTLPVGRDEPGPPQAQARYNRYNRQTP